MPESWLKNAIRKASRIGTRSRRVQKRAEPALLGRGGQDRVRLGLELRRGASGSMSRSTASPAARSPLRPSSQRGLSGMPKHISV